MSTTTPHTQTAYKDTPIGKIPADWEVKTLGEITNIYVGRDLKEENFSTSCDENHRYPVYSNTVENNGLYGYYDFSEYSGNSLTIVGRGAGLGTAFPRQGGYGAIGRLLILFPKKGESEVFISEYINSRLKIFQESSGIPQLTGEQIAKYKILLPPLPEQKRIAEVLSTWDQAIQLTEQLIRQKELRKKWLMQQLLTGKKRLKGFSGESQFRVLGKFITEVSDRNKNGEIKNVLSVTNSKGFINQAEQFEREVASADVSNYKIVRKGQFAYNPSRVNVGSLDLLRKFDIGILSPMYVVFETDQKNLIPEYLFYLLKTDWFYGHIPMFVQGSVRDSLSFDGLCGMKFFIPSIEEQTAIAEVLQTAEKEIELRKAKAEKLKEQKKGLMQQLLTGRKRLKIEIKV